jgi:very-short-patch-repair endonuclease
VLSRADALEFLSEDQLRSRLDSKAWVRLFPGVYRVEGAPTGWRQSLEALARWAGRGAALSHRTAAALHGLRGFAEGPLEVSLIRSARPPSGVTVHRVDGFVPSDLTAVDDLQVTSVTRTLADLAARTATPELRDAMDQALREKSTTLAMLARALKRSKWRPGVGDLRHLVNEFEGAGGPTESELEAKVLSLLDSSGLPRPRIQRPVHFGDKVRRLDFCFDAEKVVIEADGYAYHSSIERFEDDRQRNNSLMLRGFRVLHWTWTALEDRPEELLNELLALLASRR